MGLKVSKLKRTDQQKVYSQKKKRWYFRDVANGEESTSEFPFGHFDVHQSEDGGHYNLKKCKKNRGHSKFFPVEKFSLQHLPKDYWNHDLMDLIKAIADLTVKVDVRMTSTQRPDVWPVPEEVPYPFSTMKGRTGARLGSGIVTYLYRDCTENYRQSKGSDLNEDFTRCGCRKCQQSDTPSEAWFNITVHTATHLLFDSHASITLFYDREDNDVVILDAVKAYSSSVERDHCELKCVTCDQNLADRLKRLIDHEHEAWMKVMDGYSRDEYSRDEAMNYSVTPNVIISHPHGCPKMITVGECVDRNEVVDEEMHMLYHKYTYTASTCPGSSGAPVLCLKYQWGFNMSVVVHSGTLASGLNYSSAIH